MFRLDQVVFVVRFKDVHFGCEAVTHKWVGFGNPGSENGCPLDGFEIRRSLSLKEVAMEAGCGSYGERRSSPGFKPPKGSDEPN